MGYHCTVKRLAALIGCVTLSACATVDISNITAAQPTAAPETVAELNVVQRATSNLYTAFKDKGLATDVSKKKMRSAARILLTGLDAKPSEDKQNYAVVIGSAEALNADLIMATKHVEQARKAAEIYLAMAPVNTSVRDELISLQKALMASKKAERNFVEALSHYKVPAPDADFSAYTQSVAKLRDITDDYGLRVRSVSMSIASATIG